MGQCWVTAASQARPAWRGVWEPGLPSDCPSQGGAALFRSPHGSKKKLRQHREEPEIYLFVCLLGQEEGWGRLSSAPRRGCVLAPGQGPRGLFWAVKRTSVSPCFRSPQRVRGKGLNQTRHQPQNRGPFPARLGPAAAECHLRDQGLQREVG